jgi:nitroreductase
MKRPLAHVVLERRSRRNFSERSIPADTALALLRWVISAPMDPSPSPYLCLAVGVGSGCGIPSGLYIADLKGGSLFPTSREYDMCSMARACLEQSWLSRAKFHFLFLGNPSRCERIWGARVYRHLLIASGRLGQRVYLASTALGLGCCGVGAFFDDEAAQALHLKEQGRLIYLVASGALRSTVTHHQ